MEERGQMRSCFQGWQASGGGCFLPSFPGTYPCLLWGLGASWPHRWLCGFGQTGSPLWFRARERWAWGFLKPLQPVGKRRSGPETDPGQRSLWAPRWYFYFRGT